MKKRRYVLYALFVLLLSSVCEGNNNNNFYKSANNDKYFREYSDYIKYSRNDKCQDCIINAKSKGSTCSEQYSEYISKCISYNNLKYVSKEILLKRIIGRKGIISKWHYSDYDGDGKKEAFAAIGKNPITGVYFIDSSLRVKLIKERSNSIGACAYVSDGKCYYSRNGKGYFFVDHNVGYSPWGNKTLIFGVKKGVPYELDISNVLSGFYVRDGVVFTIRHYLKGYHVYMKTELIYDKKNQQFKLGKDLGEDSSLQWVEWNYN